MYIQANNWQPAISPDRTAIAFTSNQNNEYHIYLTDQDGKEPVRVTERAINGYHNNGLGYAWSADGQKFIFTHFDNLYRVDRSGENLTLITNAVSGRHFRKCDWSVDGKIVIQTVGENIFDNEIWLMDQDGGNKKVLISNLTGIVDSPKFTPDGEQIIYTYDISGNISTAGIQLNTHIFLMDLDGENSQDISLDKADNTNDLQPDFSPDGEKIIFVNASVQDPDQRHLYVMDRDGGNRQLVLEKGEMPSW